MIAVTIKAGIATIKTIINGLTPVVPVSSSNVVVRFRVVFGETSDVFDQITVVFRVQLVFMSVLYDEFAEGVVFSRNSDDCFAGIQNSFVPFLYRHFTVLL